MGPAPTITAKALLQVSTADTELIIGVDSPVEDEFGSGAYRLAVEFRTSQDGVPYVPPTMQNPDAKEVNDSLAVATDLGQTSNKTTTGLNIHWAWDEDFFKFKTANTTVKNYEVSVAYTSGTAPWRSRSSTQPVRKSRSPVVRTTCVFRWSRTRAIPSGSIARSVCCEAIASRSKSTIRPAMNSNTLRPTSVFLTGTWFQTFNRHANGVRAGDDALRTAQPAGLAVKQADRSAGWPGRVRDSPVMRPPRERQRGQ